MKFWNRERETGREGKRERERGWEMEREREGGEREIDIDKDGSAKGAIDLENIAWPGWRGRGREERERERER